ncbi:MAG: cation:proton antiporter, partial [Candidatus Altiarchaeota archaeon]|nr:cation:proton antiporter [Candidatus Altiarchaeota archaeon]
MKDIIIISICVVLSGVVAMEIGIITAIAELMAGIIVQLMLHHKLLSFDTPEMIEVLANIGVLTLMYVAGLEIDLDLLRTKFRKSIILGTSSFIFPFTAILLLATYITPLFFLLDSQQALLIAIIISSTSIAVIYPVLKKRSGGVLGEEEQLILGAAMIGELLTISVWTIYFSTMSEVLITFLIFLTVFTLLFPYFGRRIFSRFKGNVSEFEFKLILLLILVIAVFSEKAGIEAAIIAFLVGIATSELVIEHEKLYDKLYGMVFGFLAPIFFFNVGLNINVMYLVHDPRALLLMVLLVLVGFAATYKGVYFATRFVTPHISGYVAKLFNSNLTIGVVISL